MAAYISNRPRNGRSSDGVVGQSSRLSVSGGEGGVDVVMDLKHLLTEIEDKLADATRRRFTGEIRLIFNVSQGGFSTSYIEQERESLVKKRK